VVALPLQDLALILATAAVAAIALGILHVPSVTAFLVAGALVGPNALGIVQDVHAIEVISEVGVVLLLFTIGLEFSRQRLTHLRRMLLVGGSWQVGLTGVAAAGVALLLGQSWQRAVFFGCIAALASTAIALRSLTREDLETPHGQFVVGALVFQDLLVVPMMLAIPVLAGKGGASVGGDLLQALALAVALLGFAFLAARHAVPRLFAAVDRLRSRETFLLAVVAVCIGTAWLSSLAGLSLALGAFLAGVVLADSDYAHRALADVMPLRDVLASLFFLSLGMMFDARALWDRPVEVSVMFFGLLFGKMVFAAVAARLTGLSPRSALLAGAALAPFSEFSFVLSREAARGGLLDQPDLQVVLAAAVLTMIVAPGAVRFAPMMMSRSLPMPAPLPTATPGSSGMSGHVVVVGHGVAGQVLVRALQRSDLPYLVMELNASTVRSLRAEGVPVIYGDIANAETLSQARVEHAMALVLLINDPEAAQRAVSAARHYAPQTPILMRARYLSDVPRLQALGATEAVADEVEAGVEVLARVLRQAGLSRAAWMERVAEAREQTLQGVRDPARPGSGLHELVEEMEVERICIQNGAKAIGRCVAELQLRHRTGALVIALRRAQASGVQPAAPNMLFCAGDLVYLMGSPEALRQARAFFDALGEPAATGRTGIFVRERAPDLS